ncbi:hypothetical protein CFC21_031211 [Triticum aestivum]|uniref:Uncharacterized protein n=3 Tax=Triticinae TaxID=1648030 RepID=A0A3B5ZRY0_WHEAT|nr:uncharacterized protein LOC123180513 [Triticum aestivum]KAF7017852.1 hypothetical protein CFC21_031211 [Triticum aestivum]
MKNSKGALLAAMLLLVISSAAAGRDAPAAIAKENHLGTTLEQNGGFSESKGIAVREPIFRPPMNPPCASKVARTSGGAKEERLC